MISSLKLVSVLLALASPPVNSAAIDKRQYGPVSPLSLDAAPSASAPDVPNTAGITFPNGTIILNSTSIAGLNATCTTSGADGPLEDGVVPIAPSSGGEVTHPIGSVGSSSGSSNPFGGSGSFDTGSSASNPFRSVEAEPIADSDSSTGSTRFTDLKKLLGFGGSSITGTGSTNAFGSFFGGGSSFTGFPPFGGHGGSSATRPGSTTPTTTSDDSTVTVSSTSAAPAPPTTTSSSGGSTSSCAPLVHFHAAGTSEKGLGSVGNAFAKSLPQDVSGASVRAIDYDTSAEYSSTVTAGAKTAANDIAAIAKQCPNTKFSISGYSKGALVVHQISLSAELTAKVVAVAVFGDPTLGNSGAGYLGTSEIVTDTSCYFSFCNKGDTFCDDGSNPAAHGAYSTDGSVPKAATDIAGCYNKKASS